MKLLIIDNYDSFTFNLCHYVEQCLESGDAVDVFRNDQISINAAYEYDGIILSPGPGLPREAGIMHVLIQHAPKHLPILGICLGHQAIAAVYGAQLSNLSKPLHGVSMLTKIIDSNNPIFQNSAEFIQTGHYHSWVVASDGLPETFRIDAIGENKEIMAITHQDRPLFGIQFHPESVMTPTGYQMIANWIAFCRSHKTSRPLT